MTTQTRRRFLANSAAVTGAMMGIAPAQMATAKSPNEKLNLAIIGCGGKGWHNVEQLRHENVAILCDIDTDKLDFAAKQFPKARKYRDYRKMYDAEANNFDAVVVSTADHTHAPATAIGLDLGKHAYCEKPLTHTVQEARVITKLAEKNKLVTQMGTQIHAGNNYRRVVEIVKSGALGKISDAYVWCNKSWGGGRYKKTTDPCPAKLDWDLFLGPAPDRPYSPGVHPGNWRRFWDYGSGTFGDMACHIMDLGFWALDLTYPTHVEASGSEIHPVGAAEKVKATYKFPAHNGRAALNLHWSDGGLHHDLVKETMFQGKPLSSWGIGILFVGDKGMLAADYGRYALLPEDKFTDFEPPEQSIPNSIGHWKEWTEAIKTNGPTTCNFTYSGRLTETVLLGVAAFRLGRPAQWDAENLKSPNEGDLEELIKKQYRKGFEVVGIENRELVPA